MANPKTLFITILTSVIFCTTSYAKPVTAYTAQKVSEAKLLRDGKGNSFRINHIFAVQENPKACFYITDLHPVGYIIISGDDELPPVLAYSYTNKAEANTPLSDVLKIIYRQYLYALYNTPEDVKQARKKAWDIWLSGPDKTEKLLQQWPPDGTTTTGGWLETNWTQSAPYNQLCPIDPVTSVRSYVGCPATAMAQILNYHKTTNSTTFSDNDDYYHNYAGRNYMIDDDADAHAFPTFPQLNSFLDTLNTHYQLGVPPTAQDKAALSFACGVAAKQVYTSEGSGTFGVQQALDAYLKFNCTSAELLFDNDTTLFTRLEGNMKDALPAHLAVVDANNSTGHNVVVDGYNTDNYFHVNFGWGGSGNGWLLLPADMPYGLTVIEGLIVDILKNPNTSVQNTSNINSLVIYPNPANEYIEINTTGINIKSGYIIGLISPLGQTLFTEIAHTNTLRINLKPDYKNGLYLIKMVDLKTNNVSFRKVIIDKN